MTVLTIKNNLAVDIFDKIKNNKGPLGQYQKDAQGYFMFPKLEGEIKPRMKFRGKEVLTWSLNNYLGLANNPEVRKADAEYTAQSAYPASGVRRQGLLALRRKSPHERYR